MWFAVKEDVFVDFIKLTYDETISGKYFTHKYFSQGIEKQELADFTNNKYWIISGPLKNHNRPRYILYRYSYSDSGDLINLAKETLARQERPRVESLIENIESPETFFNNLNSNGEMKMGDETPLAKIGGEFNKKCTFEDFEGAEPSLQDCKAYSPDNAINNATYLQFNETDVAKRVVIERWKKYLEYVVDTKNKNRAKDGCKTFKKYEFDNANATKDLVGESVTFNALKASLIDLKEKFSKDTISTEGEITFSAMATRALREVENGKTLYNVKVKKDKDAPPTRATAKMIQRFNRVAGGKNIVLPGGKTIYTIGAGKLDEEVRKFIAKFGKEDNFEEIVAATIQN